MLVELLFGASVAVCVVVITDPLVVCAAVVPLCVGVTFGWVAVSLIVIKGGVDWVLGLVVPAVDGVFGLVVPAVDGVFGLVVPAVDGVMDGVDSTLCVVCVALGSGVPPKVQVFDVSSNTRSSGHLNSTALPPTHW